MSKLKSPKKTKGAAFKPAPGSHLRVGVLSEPPDAAFCDLMSELGHCAVLLKQIENDNANAIAAKYEVNHKPPGVFGVGDRVVMRGDALYTAGCLSGLDCARIWNVVECACDLCRQAGDRLLAVDQEVDGYGWRHISKVALRHYGQPTVDEIPETGSAERLDAMQRGLRQGPRTYIRKAVH